MNANLRKNWKIGAFGASVLVAGAALTYSANAADDPAVETTDAGTTVSQEPPVSGGRGGRGGRGIGGENHHLTGMDTTPPEVELAPDQSTVEATQSTTLVDGAEYYDGSYYGDAVAAGRWGYMQVVAVIEEGELVDILIADYPRSTYESDIITRNALPTLISEAIEAQDYDVDFVSRATDSSRAFVQSLESALLDAAIGMDL